MSEENSESIRLFEEDELKVAAKVYEYIENDLLFLGENGEELFNAIKGGVYSELSCGSMVYDDLAERFDELSSLKQILHTSKACKIDWAEKCKEYLKYAQAAFDNIVEEIE